MTLNSTNCAPKPILITAIISSLAGVLGSPLKGQCIRYTIEIIQPSPCKDSGAPLAVGQAISESGAIAGYQHTCRGEERAFFWTQEEGLITLTMPSSTPEARAIDINNALQVVGWMRKSANDSSRFGFFSNNGEITELENQLDDGNSVFPAAINEDGLVVGRAQVNMSEFQAFTWQQGKMNNLNIPVGPSNDANDINSAGQICGWMGVFPFPSPFAGADALFRDSDGTIVNIGELLGTDASYGTRINNVPEVCGIYYIPDGTSSPARAFLWSGINNSVRDLGLLPDSDACGAWDLNDDSVVVGSCQQDLQNVRGFVWRNDVMLTLNDLIPPESGLFVEDARAINNAGQITGQGEFNNDVVAFVLTPVPGKAGDADCDDDVDVDDLGEVFIHWGPCAESPDRCHWADLNADKVVNRDDMMLVFKNWSK